MHGGDDGMELNVAPMLDMFTILTVFLLMSFSTDPVNLDVSDILRPPMSNAQKKLEAKPNISISKKELTMNDKFVVKISPDLDVDNPKVNLQQGAIMPLYERLKEMRQNLKFLEKKNKGDPLFKKMNATLVLSADENIPFKLLKRVMLTASQAEFVTFDLVVRKPME